MINQFDSLNLRTPFQFRILLATQKRKNKSGEGIDTNAFRLAVYIPFHILLIRLPSILFTV